MTTGTVLQRHKEAMVKDQQIARFAGAIIALFTLLWAVLLSDNLGRYQAAPLPGLVASHALSLLSALPVYVYCRRLKHRTSAAGLMCFVAVAFFFVDVALAFHYSPFFGLALIAWGASARRPFLAGAGVLAIGASIVARLDHSLDSTVVAASGLIILALTVWPTPRAPQPN